MLDRLNHKWRALSERVGAGRYPPAAHEDHLRAAYGWLARAQDATPDNGVSQTFLVKTGIWAPSYPETTGYIIPTLYRYFHRFGDPDARARAIRMAEWECEIQHPTGGVLAGALGDSNEPTVFNTGQVLFGWVRAFEEEGTEAFREAAARAAGWLRDIQDDDGCWRRFGSPMTTRDVNLYNTRTAWGMARTHAITGERTLLDAAVRNVAWALAQQRENGWLPHNCLQDDRQPFTHTIAYAMRGFLEVGAYAERDDFVAAAGKIADVMVAAIRPDGSLAGRFDERWRPTVRWSCLTGNAQLAINLGRMYQLTGNGSYREAVGRINRFMKSVQRRSGPADEVGGIKGAHPIDGGYHPWQLPNWAAKFFADALMMELTLSEEPMERPR